MHLILRYTSGFTKYSNMQNFFIISTNVYQEPKMKYAKQTGASSSGSFYVDEGKQRATIK